MITLSAANLEQVYPVPSTFIREYREAFGVMTQVCKKASDYNRSSIHLHDVIALDRDDSAILAFMEDQSLLDFVALATLRSLKVKTSGDYEIFIPFSTVYLQWLKIDDDNDGLYVLPISLAVKRVIHTVLPDQDDQGCRG